MSSRFCCLVAAFFGTILAAPAIAQPSPLRQIPGKSPIVVQVRGWERTLDRVKASVKAAAPDHAETVVGQVESGLSMLLMGRELKGLAKEGPMFLVFTEVPGGDDESRDAAVVVRVTNYVQFRDGLLKDDEKKDLKAKQGYETTKIDNQEVHFIDREGYAIVALSEKALKLFLDKKADSLASKLDKTLAGKLLDADISAYVDMKAVTKQFGDQIDSFKTLMEQVIQPLQDMGVLEKDQFELVKRIYDGLFRLIEDTETVVVSADFRNEGFMLRLHTQVGEKSKTNEALKPLKPTPLDSLANLPTGQMMYMTGSSDQEWVKELISLMTTGAGGGSASKSIKALADMKVARWATGTDDGTSHGLRFVEYADSRKAVDATLQMYRDLPENGSFAGTILKGRPAIKADAEKLNGISFHSVKIVWDIDRTVEKFPEQLREAMKTSLQQTLGEGQNSWFGSDGKIMLHAMAKDWPSARKMLEAFFSGKDVMGIDAGYLNTRKQLPAEANMLVISDAGRIAFRMAKMMNEQMKNLGGGGNAPKLPDGKPSYIGLALGMQPRNGTLDIWVPAEAVKAIIKVLAPLFGEIDR